MKCPHCQVAIHEKYTQLEQRAFAQEGGSNTSFSLYGMECPDGSKAILLARKYMDGGITDWFFYPRNVSRVQAAVEVPADIAEDFNEAGAVLPISPKALAALSRRCLQAVLRAQGYSLLSALSEVVD